MQKVFCDCPYKNGNPTCVYVYVQVGLNVLTYTIKYVDNVYH